MKIPSKPKIPPPFPVQLQDDGPIQILEAAPDDDSTSQTQAGAHRGHKADSLAGRVKVPYAQGAAAIPPQENYGGGAGWRPGKPPLDPARPPIDEDDPSIYYPPPYSFYYPKDNSSAVPPGPLVPGIVLPPPPNFFGRLSPPSTTIMPPYRPPTSRPVVTTTARPVTTTTAPTTTKGTTTTTTPAPPKSTTTKYYLPPVIVTSTPLPPIVSQAPKPVYFEYFETNKLQPVAPQRQPQQPPMRTYVSSTAVPLRAFFKTPTRPAQFFFYEEDPRINEVNTPKAPQRIIIATVARPQPKPQLNVNNFENHIQQLRQQIRFQQQRQQRYHQPRFRQPRPVYQYSFGYDDRVRPTPQPPRQYTVQIQPSVDYRRPSIQDIPQIVTPSPIINQQNVDYQHQIATPNPIIQENVDYRRPIIQEIQQITPNPIEYRRPVQETSQIVTPNPVLNHGYYTKQEEGIFDDITKKYFTVFGQKLTSPLPPLLRNDLNVNYRRPLPPQNPQAEFIVEGVRPLGGTSGEGGPGTFISYRLPGDGAHFYFVTPQLAQQQQLLQQQRQRSDNQESGYYYPSPSRLRRRT